MRKFTVELSATCNAIWLRGDKTRNSTFSMRATYVLVYSGFPRLMPDKLTQEA
jgi:hypothetical protein